MNIQRIQLIWGAVALLAAGCSQEQATSEEAYSDVRIEPRSSIVSDQVIVQPGEATRGAVDGTTQELTFYFLRANQIGADKIYADYSNAVVSAVRPGGADVQPLTFESDLFYLSSGGKSKFTGWHPQATSVTDGVVSWTLDGTQDVLTAPVKEGSYLSLLPAFAFQHRLAQLQFMVRADNVKAQTAWGTITEINLLEQPNVCRYTPGTNDATGNVTFDANSVADFKAKNLVAGKVPLNKISISDPMMIAPQSTATVLILVIKSSTGKEAQVKIPSTTYLTGKAYNVNIVLKEREAETSNATVVAWTTTADTPQVPMDPINMVDLSKDSTANCYIITTDYPVPYVFNARVRGNGYESTTDSNVKGISYSTLPKLEQATTARVIWQTGTSATNLVVDPASVKLEDDKVKFNLGKAREGNAVIGIFASTAATAPCIWSWHIWRLDGDLPADVDCVKTPSPASASPTFKMMGLSLGALNNTPDDPKSKGLLYEWGRKDPLPSSAGWSGGEPTNIYGSVTDGTNVRTFTGPYTLLSWSEAVTEAWAVQYPGVYIPSWGTGAGTWVKDSKAELWGNPWVDGGVTVDGIQYNGSQGVKSIYDPCPVGYRVPPHDTFNKHSKGDNVSWVSDGGSVLFQYGALLAKTAPGLWIAYGVIRSLETGNLSGGIVAYWLSSPNGYRGISMRSDKEYGGLLSVNTSYALAIRCVRENSLKK